MTEYRDKYQRDYVPDSTNASIKADYEVTTKELEGVNAKFHSLSWPRLTVCLIVEAIALGSLSMPASMATLGLVPGVLITVFMGLLATHCSINVGEVKFRCPQVVDYPGIGRLMFGKAGYVYFAISFVMLLTLTTASHVLTSVIAFNVLSANAICSIIFSVVGAVLLYVLALPTSFHDMAVLGYIDCASIGCAILITMVATGIQATKQAGGMAATTWHAFRPADEQPTFAEAFLAVTNIAFAYAFAQCLPSMSSQLRHPHEYKKALWTLGLTEIFLYTIIGAVIYVFVGNDVKSPSLLSASPMVQKVAFGVALPVIFISGSINTTTAALYIHEKIYPSGVHRLDAARRTGKSYAMWLFIVAFLTLIAWVVAQSIPSFGGILGLISALFISCFSIWAPGLMWFMLLKDERPWYSGSNLFWSLLNGLAIVLGMVLLVCGVYASAEDLKVTFAKGVGAPWSCTANQASFA